MQIQCPQCRQTLEAPQGVPQAMCPFCGVVINLAGATGPAVPYGAAGSPAYGNSPGGVATAPVVGAPAVGAPAGVGVQTRSAPSTTARLARRQKSRTPLLVLGIGGPLVLLGLIIAASIWLIQGPEERPLTAVDVTAQRTNNLVARELSAGPNALFATEGYKVEPRGANRWMVHSHIDVPTRNGAYLRQVYQAEIEGQGDETRLVSLLVNGRRYPLQSDKIARSSGGGDGPRTYSSWARGGSDDDDSSSSAARERTSPSIEQTVRQLADALTESAKLRPTFVVWLIDQTPSAESWRQSVHQNFDPMAEAIRKSNEKLKMAVVGFGGDKVAMHLEDPLADDATVRISLEATLADEGSTENTFDALTQVARKFGPLAQAENGYLEIIVVTDEAGSDVAKVDEAIAELMRVNAVVHVIGKEALFGRGATAATNGFGSENAGADTVVNGPETLRPERINLGYWNSGYSDPEELSSGYGPYHLARVCSETGGDFFTCTAGYTRSYSPWGAAKHSVSFTPESLRKYRPRYMSQAAFEAQYGSNLAVAALHKAASLPKIDVNTVLAYDFVTGDEAAMKRRLDEAQRGVARLEPRIAELHDALKAGEKDRAKLDHPRLQAAYDLAMGRALAAKARIEGYNAMLALLKQGKKFEKEGSTMWSLTPANSISASSALERSLKEAKTYLERVQTEHPDTPWAHLAELELRDPLGWEWQER